MRVVAAALLLTACLAGCSGDPEQEYCDELKGATTALMGFASGAPENGDYLEPALRLLEGLREDAPEELRDEWDTFVFAWRDLVDVLRDTGVDPTTFDPTKKPDDLSREDFRRIKAVGAELGSPRVRDAVDGISEHARDVCGLSLDL